MDAESNFEVWLRRHPNDWATAVYRFADVQGLRWDRTSGGVNKRTSRPALFGYVMCDGAVEGKVAHTCKHGAPPHRIKVCLPKVCNKERWKAILAKSPPRKGHPRAGECDQGMQTVRSGKERVEALGAIVASFNQVVEREKNAKELRSIFSQQHLKMVDKWIKAQNDPSIDRPEAVRRLVELGLKAKAK